MSKSSSSKLQSAAFAAAASMIIAGTASAYNAFPYVEQMGGDQDAYLPADTNMADDGPAFTGSLPPGDNSGGFGSFNNDWDVERHGTANQVTGPAALFGGDIEELPSGHFGINTGDGSGHFALAQFGDPGTYYAYRTGPFGRMARHFDTSPGGPQAGNTFWATVDVYIDPAQTSGGFWINQAVNSIAADTYLTETSWRISTGPAGWTINASGANTVTLDGDPNVAGDQPFTAGQWTRWETRMLPGSNGRIVFQHDIFGLDVNGDYTVLLDSALVGDYQNLLNAYGDIAGPRWQWITSGTPQFPHIFVDNQGWTNGTIDIGAADPIPEPTGLAMIALGGLAAARRRRR